MIATRRTALALISLLISAGAMTACSSGSDDQRAADWSGFTVSGLEVDPPMSLDDLSSNATTIVLAHAIDVVEVPPEISGLPKDAAVVAITFKVDEWVKGDGGYEISVVRPRQPVDTVDELRKRLPSEQVLLFATDAGYGGYLALTSDLGAIAERHGELVAVFDEPLSPNVVPEKTQKLTDLIELAR